ncbi:MAG: PAS domain S-box protein [Ardenticatenaceae bacterium]|nr:PAS domain S-box protein [Ardenticatenaceae bacterium]
MKQSQKQTHTIEVLYELALSIGTSLDLQQMLATSMQAFAEELDCAVSTTYRSQATEAAYKVEAVGTYPHGADKAETEQLALANLPATPAEPQLTQFKESLPLVGAGADDDYYHLLDLPGFGFLLLIKDEAPLDKALLEALRSLQDKLATAAAACAPAVATPVTTAGVEQSQEMVHEYLYMHRGLYEINNELMHLDDMDELYRRVVELAHTRLGFDRVGMFLLNEAKDALVGTYGVDDSGNVRSEQGPEYNITNPETIESYVFNADRLSVQDDAELFHDNVVVGRGWQIGVAMWVDETPIGVMFADNLITGQPLKPYQAQLLFAYSSIVASLIVRHRTDESIHERETLLRTIIDSTPDWIFVKDRDHRYQLVNKGYADTMGMPPEEFIGKNDLDVGFPEEIVKGDPEKGIRGFWADDNEIMAQGELKIIDEEPAVIDGEQRYLHTVKAPLKDADDEVTGLVGFVHDITKQKATAEALEAANAHTETILQAITVPVLISRVKSGEIGYANEHLAQLVRMPLDQLVGNATPNFYVRNEDRTAVVGKIQKVGSVNNYQLQLRRTDGEAFWALLSARLIDFEGEPAIITSLIEITDRIEAEQSLRQSEKELSQALEIAKLGYWEYDVEKDIFTLNDQFYTVYGMTAEQHGGYQVSSEYFTQHFVYPDDQMVVGEEIARAVNSTEQHYTRQIEHRILFPDGSVGYIVVNVNLERDEQGNILRFYGANQDITTLKQAELRLQENQSRLAEANRISNLYPWEFDVATEMFTFTPEYFELLGISVEENGGLQISAQEYATKFVPPEEAAIVATEVGEAMATDDPNFSRDFESVNLTTDGKIIPVRVRFRIEKDAQGNTIKTYGANQDISEQKAVEATLAKQAEELQTVAEVATNAASAMDEAALLQDVVSLTKERFNLYHAHIYLLDEAGENLVLTAGAGEVGQQMVADGRSIPFDQEQSLVARAARTQQGVIVNDVRSEPNFLPNPLLPDTRAEMAVPMIVGTRVLGVLDVQADTTDYFTAQDVQIQTTLAAQMAVALENVRLLNEARVNEERYRTILDNANEIVFTLTPEGDFTYLSPAWTGLLGYTLEEGIGHSMAETLHPDDLSRAFTYMEELAAGSAKSLTYQQRHKNGDWRWFTANGSAVKDEAGNVSYFMGLAQDITERKAAEERIRANEELMRTIIDSTPDWIFVKDEEHRYQLVNQGYANALHIAPEDFIGKNDLELGFPEELVKGDPEKGIRGFWADDRLVMDSGEMQVYPDDPATIDGEVHTFHTIKSPLKTADGQAWGVLAFARDITERIQSEAAIAKQAEELQTVAEVATNAASAMDEAALLQDVVSLTKERFNLYHAHIYLLDEAGENLVLTAGAGVVGQQMVADGRSIPFDQEQSLVARAARTQQGVIVNDVRSEPNFLPNPLLPDTRAEMAVPMIVGTRVLGVLDVQADTTDYFTAQDVQIQTTLAAQMAVALENVRLLNVAQANEERYRTILDNANEIIFTLTPEGNFTYLSPAWTELLGYTMEEGEGHSFAEFLHPDDIGRAFTYMEELAAGGGNAQSFTYRQRHKNGDWRWFVTNGSAVKDEASNIRYFIGLAQDITEQRLAEVQLQENQERLAEANRISKLYPWEFDVATGMFTFIPEYFELLGTSVEENGGLQISAEDYATKFVPSEEAPIVGAEVGKAMLADDPNYSRDFESINLTAGGRRVPIYVRFRLEKDAQGNTIRLFGANQDITEQKEAELQLQENQQRLAEANRISKLYPWEFELETETFTFEPEYLELLGTSEEENGGLQMSAEEFAKYAPPEYAPIVAAEVEKVRIADDPNYSSDFEYVNLTKDGRLIPISVRIRIEKDVNGNTVKIFGVNQDITEQKAVEATLRQNEAELSQALELAKLGYWEYDVKNDLFTFNDQFYSLFHTTAEEHGGYRVSSGYYAQHFVHPDDTEMVGGEIGMALSSTDSYYNRQLEHRILYADGGIGYISVNVNVERDEQGDILRFYGANQDITDRKLAEVAVAKQAKELQVVAELSTTVATTLEQEKLLQQVIDLTKERFDFYHAQIYLLDAQHEKLSLAFGAGDVGRQLVSQKHQIDLNAVQSLVAQAARSGQAIVVNAVRENPNWLANALLPETQAEMAVPMMVGNHVLGVLDVQSEVVNRFTEQDVQIQTTLAAQVSIALENARSFEQAQTAVAEMNALTRRLTHEGWDDYFDTVPNENLRFLFDGSSVQEAQDTAVDSALPENPDELLERPIEIRGVKIGKMAIVPEEEDTEMEEVVNSVMQQLASHIENLRLTEQVQTSLAQTEALYTGSERIVLSSTEEDILQSLVLSTELRKLDRANIFMFDEPVEDGVARDVMVVATWVNEGIPPSVQVGTRFEVENVPFLATVRPDSTLVIRDVREDSRVDEQTSKILEGFGMISFTMFPIVVGSQWLGIVSGQSSKPLYMNDVHLRQATSLVSQAAVVMQTTILFRQEQARARREQMLREIAAKVRSSTDVDTIMRTAVTEIGRTLGRRSFIKLGNGQLDSQQNDNGNGATS